MDKRGLKPHPWAKTAGIRSSTLYNYLSGLSGNLTADTLQKLAQAAGTSVDELLGISSSPPKGTAAQPIRIDAVVGIYGRVFNLDVEQFVPIAINDIEVCAARIDKDGLHPVPGGWILVYEKTPRSSEDLIGKLAVVELAAQGHRLVREVHRGTRAGLYTLTAWNAAMLEDVEIVAAHAVVSINQTA